MNNHRNILEMVKGPGSSRSSDVNELTKLRRPITTGGLAAAPGSSLENLPKSDLRVNLGCGYRPVKAGSM